MWSFSSFWVFLVLPLFPAERSFLSSLTADSSCQLDVLWHNGHTLGVNGAQVGVLKQTDQVSFAGLLEGTDGCTLEPEISFEVLSNFSHEPLEGEFTDEKLGGFLVTTDLTEGDGSRPVPVGLLDSTGGRCRLPGSLGGQLLPGGLASGGLTGGLLCTGHGWLANLDWLPRIFQVRRERGLGRE